MSEVYATGRRKTAVAKVRLTSGKGNLSINGMDIDTWLGGHESIKNRLKQPLIISKQEKNVDINVLVSGSGYSAQADAVKHGITRALVKFNEEMRAILKPYGLLTRDARKVERKKYGRHKARRSPQFSKR